MGPMPWTVNSEIYPLWARSTGNACSSGINWIFNVLVSLTFLHTAEYLTYYGKRVLFPTLFLDMLSFVIERLYCYISAVIFLSCVLVLPSPWKCTWGQVRGTVLCQAAWLLVPQCYIAPPTFPAQTSPS